MPEVKRESETETETETETDRERERKRELTIQKGREKREIVGRRQLIIVRM